jgi:hypothetical protein
VGALPDHWIDAAGEQILCRLVCQAAIAEHCEQQLRELRAQPCANDEAIAALAGTHRDTAKSIAYLLTTLRATPRSRVVSRAAGPQMSEVPHSKPWDTPA